MLNVVDPGKEIWRALTVAVTQNKILIIQGGGERAVFSELHIGPTNRTYWSLEYFKLTRSAETFFFHNCTETSLTGWPPTFSCCNKQWSSHFFITPHPQAISYNALKEHQVKGRFCGNHTKQTSKLVYICCLTIYTIVMIKIQTMLTHENGY